jgi:hypothetical protein
VAEANCQAVVVSDYKNPQLYVNYMDVVRLFMGYPKLYSWPFIAYMKEELADLGKGRIKNTKCFLDLLNHDKVFFNVSDLPRLAK